MKEIIKMSLSTMLFKITQLLKEKGEDVLRKEILEAYGRGEDV